MVSSNRFYLIIAICLDLVACFQEIMIILSKQLYLQVTIHDIDNLQLWHWVLLSNTNNL